MASKSKRSAADKASKTRQHYERVLAASSARYSAQRILIHMMFVRGGFYEAICRISKPQLVRELGLHPDTVRDGLRFLREEGSIFAVEGAQGGRVDGGAGQAPTYRFIVVGQGGQKRPDNAGRGAGSAILDAFADAFEDAVFDRWIAPLTVSEISGDRLIIAAPTGHSRDYIARTHADALLDAARSADATIRKIEIIHQED